MKGYKLVGGLFLGMVLVFSLALVAWADGGSVSASSLSGGVGVGAPDSNNAALVDDQKKQKGFDPGFPEVDPSGAFQYQYPLNLPPGTHNMAPNLTLFYNSNSPNGMLGMGWNLNGIMMSSVCHWQNFCGILEVWFASFIQYFKVWILMLLA